MYCAVAYFLVPGLALTAAPHTGIFGAILALAGELVEDPDLAAAALMGTPLGSGLSVGLALPLWPSSGALGSLGAARVPGLGTGLLDLEVKALAFNPGGGISRTLGLGPGLGLGLGLIDEKRAPLSDTPRALAPSTAVGAIRTALLAACMACAANVCPCATSAVEGSKSGRDAGKRECE